MRATTMPPTRATFSLVVCILAAGLSSAFAGDYDPIILPGKVSPTAKLALFVPGGKVPPEDYSPFLSKVLAYSDTNIFGAIVHCGKLNLCDPLGQLNGLIAGAITAAAKANGGHSFAPADIFVMGHSLGGVGARHYVDTFSSDGPAAFAGLALFGTQYNGDHEDFKGTLGYPVDLKSFPTPLLALLGEIDMVPAASHAGLLFAQYTADLDDAERAQKPVVVVPGMDHSQFCTPFHVAGDNQPEIPDDLATHYAGMVTATWVDAQATAATNTATATTAGSGGGYAATLAKWVANSTAPIVSSWVTAHAMEAADWCAAAQRIIIGDLPAADTAKINIDVVTVNGSAPLEHQHPSYKHNPSTGKLDVVIASYPFYPQESSWNPLDIYGPTYGGAKDISCKLLSADRIAEQLNLTGYFPQAAPPVTCDKINEAAVGKALDLLNEHWPAAVSRFHRRGRNFTFAVDSNTIAGPQWVFLSELKFKPGKTDNSDVTVTSPHLYSSITSKIYPGNFYCKVLSPAKALEWIQTTGLRNRY